MDSLIGGWLVHGKKEYKKDRQRERSWWGASPWCLGGDSRFSGARGRSLLVGAKRRRTNDDAR